MVLLNILPSGDSQEFLAYHLSSLNGIKTTKVAQFLISSDFSVPLYTLKRGGPIFARYEGPYPTFTPCHFVEIITITTITSESNKQNYIFLIELEI